MKLLEMFKKILNDRPKQRIQKKLNLLFGRRDFHVKCHEIFKCLSA